MNHLSGKVASIECVHDLVCVNVRLADSYMKLLALQPLHLENHSRVELLFKEYSVLLAKAHSILGCENSYLSPIQNIVQGQLLWQIFLDFQGVSVSAILTATAAHRLELTQQKELAWCISPSEITLKEIHV